MKTYDSGLTTEVIARAQRDEWLDRMLDNWRRWAAGDIGGPQAFTACASAERHYAIPVWDGEDHAALDAPDELAGESMDMAWSRLPALQRQVLRAVHLQWPLERVRTQRGCATQAADADRFRARELRIPLALMLETYAQARPAVARMLRQGVMS
ncbi:hypothetical protein [Solimonas sp. SE-A11]|uniref:hypothetical protein n=1 Tax=Solimonas sp. SE-A11 TaxID=3054954 RepID=UPI00259CB492|nr:hypothetical protein [Solimonas sp. SE-A11]MDM4772743.1 hypothetical protein [Solimonas sp. SE-A11]